MSNWLNNLASYNQIYVNKNSKNDNNMIIVIDTIIIPNNFEKRLSIWYRKTLVKPSAGLPRL